MKAVAYTQSLPIQDSNSLNNVELDKPAASGHDLLVAVNAIAVNPVDYKIRQNVVNEDGSNKVIGWDAVGEVVAVGEEVSLFKAGDTVFYAGDLTRPGSNAEYQLVDEALVGHKPKTISNAEAAALPLTAITAWELLFEHLNIQKQEVNSQQRSDEVILVVGAAGGVGSILLQIVKAITGATVIATASRESSQAWVKKLGADYVINHHKSLPEQIDALGLGPVTHVASLNSTESYFDDYIEVLAPFGKIALIDDPAEPLEVKKLKLKSLSLHLEFMFARSMFNEQDKAEQGVLLNEIADLVDGGHIQTTVSENLGTINADNLKQAHASLESGTAIGKIVLEGFAD